MISLTSGTLIINNRNDTYHNQSTKSSIENFFDKGLMVSKPAVLLKLTKDFDSIVSDIYYGS